MNMVQESKLQTEFKQNTSFSEASSEEMLTISAGYRVGYGTDPTDNSVWYYKTLGYANSSKKTGGGVSYLTTH